MILVTGADGLLGAWICFKHSKDVIGLTRKDLDITDEVNVLKTLRSFQPDAVINCAGLTDNRGIMINPEERIAVNAEAPQVMSKICDMLGIRMIQVSTDCVFKGDKNGGYTEMDIPDADDNYGWSKSQGEIDRAPHLTVRTSFVGWPDTKMRGLIAWLRVTSRTQVLGYANVRWNGLTAPLVADYLVELAYTRHTGIMHLFGSSMSKYDILTQVKEVYRWAYPFVVPSSVPVSDRTLDSIRTDRIILPNTFDFRAQLEEMKSLEKRFDKEWRETVYRS